MKYLITGGAGFIGSHLAERLLSEGHEVAVLDNLSTGSSENLKSMLFHPQFKFVLGDVETCDELAPLMAWADTVFHLAAAVGVELVVTQPVYTIETNVHATERVLTFAAKTNTKIFVASTSEVYGKATNEVFRETDDILLGPPTHFRWSYAASKALDEYLGLAFHKEKGTRVIITRFFNTVGPRQTGRYGMVVPRFVAQALKNEPIRIHGDGEQIRCFCHVQDTVDALIRLDAHPQAVGEIFNIGRSEPISISDLGRRVVELLGSRSTMVKIPYSEAYAPGFEDMRRRVPDTTKLRTYTQWAPRKTLDEIILEVGNSMRAAGQA